MTRCSFCNHPFREQYERKIVSKELTMSRAAQLMNSNKATVSRHMRNCFPKKVAEWVKPEAAKEETLNVVNALVASRQTTLDILTDALADGDRRTGLLALQIELKQLTLLAKLTGQLQEGNQINLLLSPDYLELKQIVYASLQDFPEARLRVSEALSKGYDEQRS